MTAIHLAALVIEVAGSLLLLSYVLVALTALIRRHGLERSRLLLADGAIFALGFKTGASLLKTLELGTWRQIGAFAAIFALRTVLKRAIAADKATLLRGSSRPLSKQLG